MEEKLYGGVEAGGTKFICAIGRGESKVLAKAEIRTTTPQETLNKVVAFFRTHSGIAGLGIGCFGPIQIKPGSENYGTITNTPKPGWSNLNIHNFLHNALEIPVTIETDVNCAALGEFFFGAASNQDNFLYLTIGTGIGGSAFVDGKLIHGSLHPEMGHIKIPHNLSVDDFAGVCPYHGDCFEGLASGVAMEKRAGKKAEHVVDPVRWDLEAEYVALGVANLATVLSPDLVILGGGMMLHGGLIEEISRKVDFILNKYVRAPKIIAATGENAVLGAIKLAAITHNGGGSADSSR